MKIKEAVYTKYHDGDTLTFKFDISEREQIGNMLKGLSFPNDYTLQIKKKRKKRSLDANSYYWVLVKKIASVLGATLNEIHNEQLSKYGTLMTDNDNKVLYCLYKASIDYKNFEQVHLKPTGKTEDRNGTLYAWFYVLKPTHLMNSKEMSDLIDGTKADCAELGINTEGVVE